MSRTALAGCPASSLVCPLQQPPRGFLLRRPLCGPSSTSCRLDIFNIYVRGHPSALKPPALSHCIWKADTKSLRWHRRPMVPAPSNHTPSYSGSSETAIFALRPLPLLFALMCSLPLNVTRQGRLSTPPKHPPAHSLPHHTCVVVSTVLMTVWFLSCEWVCSSLSASYPFSSLPCSHFSILNRPCLK